MLDLEKIANNLYTLRKQRNITQTELAEALNVTHQAVSKWENANSLPDLEVLASLAEYYGVTMDEIINGSLNGEKKITIKSKIDFKDSGIIEFLINQLRLWAMLVMIVFSIWSIIAMIKSTPVNVRVSRMGACVTSFIIGVLSLALAYINLDKDKKSTIKFIIEGIFYLTLAIINVITF